MTKSGHSHGFFLCYLLLFLLFVTFYRRILTSFCCCYCYYCDYCNYIYLKLLSLYSSKKKYDEILSLIWLIKPCLRRRYDTKILLSFSILLFLLFLSLSLRKRSTLYSFICLNLKVLNSRKREIEK